MAAPEPRPCRGDIGGWFFAIPEDAFPPGIERSVDMPEPESDRGHQ